MADDNRKLGVTALAALVVSAMIGGGIFSLPQNMAQQASVTAVIIAWVVTGIGMFFIANTFRILADARPDATTGIYAYARLGFGRFAGFQMAWSYWLCNIFGNVGFAVLLMDALNYFFPGAFTGGNNLWSILGGSLVIWIMNFAVLAGMRQAAFINTIGTICKLVPIALFIVIMLFAFRWAFFSTDMTGSETIPQLHIRPLGSMLKQVQSTMMVTLWAFIGIEGAVVVSGRAGAAVTAHIGTMAVTEQLDALYTLGTNPTRYLVIPRLFAFLLTMPVLTVFSNVFGVIGGYLVAAYALGVPGEVYFTDITTFMGVKDFMHGFIKSFIFAFMIATVCCYKGVSTRGGAEGVGKSTTGAVVTTIVLILVLDYFLTAILTAFGI